MLENGQDCVNSQADAGDRRAVNLRDLILRLQSAPSGSTTLDTLVDDALQSLRTVLKAAKLGPLPPPGSANWSENVNTSVGLLGKHYDFSIGRRDYVCWAWIQPNDGWQRQDHDLSHDHPEGSGLAVAHTLSLALTTALLRICDCNLRLHGS